MKRREFIMKSATIGVAASFLQHAPSNVVAGAYHNTICAFSKTFQWLNYNELSEFLSEAGFEGIDLTVRQGGHVLPENVEKDLPAAVAAAQTNGLTIPMIVTGIRDASDPFTERILKTASQVGIKHYRFGNYRYDKQLSTLQNLAKIGQQLADLGALNAKYDLQGGCQNHVGTYFGSPVWDLWYLIKNLDPRYISCQYDVRHAAAEGVASWSLGFEAIASHVVHACIKDFTFVQNEKGKWGVKSVPLGTGAVDYQNYFRLRRKHSISGPLSIHYEFPLEGDDKLLPTKERVGKILPAVRREVAALRSFLTMTIIGLLPIGSLFAEPTGGGITANKERPNIVVIVADDLLSAELSCYGGCNLTTPNIDRIAREGVLFSNNYASTAMSVPIRASMYTGLYPVRHGSYQNHKGNYRTVKNITDYMPTTGYRLARTGKQHPGPLDIYKFEEIPGFPVSCTSHKANYTVDDIRDFMIRDEQPFCLFVCSIHPHVPWTWGNPNEFDPDKLILPPTMDNDGIRKTYCNYLAEVRSLDNEVGSILEVLTQTGKLDNTLVIFLGEQGPQLPGGKWTCWNPGVKSALVARYPVRIKAGSTSDAIVQYEDMLPTLIEVAGGKPIADIDGKSFLHVLYGEKTEHRKWAYLIHNNIPEGTAYPIRGILDKQYKLIHNLTPEVDYFEKHLMDVDSNLALWAEWLKTTQSNQHALYLHHRFVKRPAMELYDISKDPWELDNLADKPQYQDRIADMQKELEKWMKQQGDTGIALDVAKITMK
jgi:uncharacterized sulfatase